MKPTEQATVRLQVCSPRRPDCRGRGRAAVIHTTPLAWRTARPRGVAQPMIAGGGRGRAEGDHCQLVARPLGAPLGPWDQDLEPTKLGALHRCPPWKADSCGRGRAAVLRVAPSAWSNRTTDVRLQPRQSAPRAPHPCRQTRSVGFRSQIRGCRRIYRWPGQQPPAPHGGSPMRSRRNGWPGKTSRPRASSGQ